MAYDPNRDKPVWERAEGKWDWIYARLASDTLGPALAKPGRHVPCPVHGGVDGFRLREDFAESGRGGCNSCGFFPSGLKLLCWLYGWDSVEAIKEVEKALGDNHVANHTPDRRPSIITAKKDDDRDEFKIRNLRETWEESVSLGHPTAEPARLYFVRRSLIPMRGPLEDVRFHPNLGYWHEGKSYGRFPALVSMIRQSDGQPASIHRIYLTETGAKAPVPKVKKMMEVPSHRTASGAAVRLAPSDGRVLHVAEGIESALAARIIVENEPTWSCLSTSILTTFVPPTHVRVVCVWQDLDPATKQGIHPGSHAANQALDALRKRGVHTVIAVPPQIAAAGDSVDWNDVLERYGAEAIRQWTFYRNLRREIAKRLNVSRPFFRYGS